MPRRKQHEVRRLVLIPGDQLNADSAGFDEFDRDRDMVWTAEVGGESTHVWTQEARIAMFLAAMRHFVCSRGQSIEHPEGRK
jgi:deoxyribodipyrimidine photolyase-related protein